ncbi:MAG: type VI secretion system ATPase TssH [Deltaproteobacteria bacterium HGW-Deltaproteobacteria-21]|nr:MAG: type VI secretion system ATPase TssH [Deltaproteobacteria bacterium HGW-Deltaproteobacteria-21]
MITVDMKSLISRLNPFCTNALQSAAGLCVSRTHYEVTVEHFLSKLLDEPRSDVPLLVKQFDLDGGRVKKALEQSLEEFRTGNAAKPVFSPLLLELFQDAWMVSSIDLGERKIRSGSILLAFVSKPAFFASGRYVDMLKSIGRESLLKQFWTVAKASLEHGSTPEEGGERDSSAEGRPGPSGDSGFLARFCTDFTQKAKDGKIDPVFGRDHEIRQIIDILGRRRKNNPICVGEPGVGKTAVVEGLALRITQDDVPDLLKGVTLLGLDMGLLEAGAGVKGEFENRLKGVINEIKGSEKPIILFIDEAHTLVGAGGAAGGGDAANLLKPALARGELRTVAATTWSEYKKYFEKDPALARRFQPVKLDAPDVAISTLILRGLKESYEKSHKVIVRDDAIQAAAELSDRYITGRFLPDKAIDLLDTSCARVKINLTAKPDMLEDKERTIQALEREKTALERDRNNGVAIDAERLAEIGRQIETRTREAEALKERWLKEQEAAKKVLEVRARIQAEGDEEKKKSLKKEMEDADKALKEIQGEETMIRIEVDPDMVAKVVSDWTGVPLGKVMRDQAQNILRFESQLKERIKGQDHALHAISEVIKAAKSGIKDPSQPLGVFLLVGPSGVGKTETALSVADMLFGGEHSVVTINMSEFQEKHTVSRLIGSPPGYVGYGEGGMLTEAVRHKPYSVVLLDEVEKAHLEVLNLFYQVFDKGMLSDGEGREIDFKNTVMFLTSNLATDVIAEMTKTAERAPDDVILSAVRPILSQHFKPALLARMTVIPFYLLPADAMKGIVRLKLAKLAKRLLENNKIKLTYTDGVVDQIAQRCTEVETGARNIDYILAGNIMPQMSQQILSHMSTGGMPSEVHLDVGEDGVFRMEFK